MNVAGLHVECFRCFRTLDLDLNPLLNIIVGDNECGKSSTLEALNLGLTGQIDGRSARYELDPYVLHQPDITAFFAAIRDGGAPNPPRMLIEVYLRDDGSPEAARHTGTNNSRRADEPGLSFSVELEDELAAEFNAYVRHPQSPVVLPVEYYRIVWRSFADADVNPRRLPLRTVLIDATLKRSRHEPNRFVARMVGSVLDSDQQRSLALSYRQQRCAFVALPEIESLNSYLASVKGEVSEKTMAVALDMSSRSTWETDVATHLDNVPFDLVGSGEQARIRVKLAISDKEHAGVLLVEEPENHLSHSNMSRLLDDIATRAEGKQVVITTHSAFVLNKLGLDRLLLLGSRGQHTTLAALDSDTRNYFMKLPGFDTLRMILASKAILVEGASDELVVLKAYKQLRGKTPLADGADVISVGGLAFKRFLAIARQLQRKVAVVTDNDGKIARLERKYQEFKNLPSIKICYDPREALPSLEDQIIEANGHETIAAIIGCRATMRSEVIEFMKQNKTDAALRIIESTEPFVVPDYIREAIEF